MNIPISGLLAEWLQKDGRAELVKAGTATVDDDKFKALVYECARTHPDYSSDYCHAWAAFSLLTHGKTHISSEDTGSRAMQSQQVRLLLTGIRVDLNRTLAAFADAVRRDRRLTVAWRIAVLLLLGLIFGALVAKAAPDPQMMQNMRAVIISSGVFGQTQGSLGLRFANGASVLATRTGGIVQIKCSTGMSCSWANNIFTLTSTGGGGGGATVTTQLTDVSPTPASSSGQILIWDSGSSTYIPGDPLVQGLTAHDAVGTSTNPVAVGGFASAAAPSAVSADGDIVRQWHLRNGSQVVNLASGGTLITVGQTTMSASLPVTIASNQTAILVDGSGVTQPVSIASVPSHAVTNAGTFAVQAAIADGASVTLGAKADAKSTATDTTAITIMQVLKEISAMEQAPASRAVTNAGTFATQAAESGTWTVQPGNTANTTAWLVTGTGGTFPVTAASGSIASGAIASGAVASGAFASGSIADGAMVTLGAKADAKSTATDTTSITIMQVLKEISAMAQAPAALPANQTVNLAQVGGTNTVTGGINGTQAVGGCVATNVATPCSPLNLGAQAVSSENSAATTAREVQLVADLVGKLIVLPYANPENFVSGTTSAMTSTTSTLLVASPGGSLRNYITSIQCKNSHATVGTFVTVQDGSGGTALMTLAAASVYGGDNVPLPTPLRQPTTATGLYVADVTTGANVICSAQGYKGL